MRPRPRALGMLLATVLVFGAPIAGPTVAQAPAASPTCDEGFAVAAGLVAAVDAARAGESAPDAPSDADRAALAGAMLDLTIRSCDDPTTWLIAADAYPELLGGDDPLTTLVARCIDPASGLAATPACGGSIEPSPSPSPRLVKLPSIKPKVKGAQRTRYYPIEGLSPDQLFTQMQVKGSEHCPTHAVACTLISPTIRPLVTAGSRCRVVGIKANLDVTAWIPVWTSPKRVPPELVDWWRTVSTRVAKHEAEHIRIAQGALNRLKKEIMGKSCASLNAYATRWSKQLTAAQDAWDLKEADRPWPEYDGPLPPDPG